MRSKQPLRKELLSSTEWEQEGKGSIFLLVSSPSSTLWSLAVVRQKSSNFHLDSVVRVRLKVDAFEGQLGEPWVWGFPSQTSVLPGSGSIPKSCLQCMVFCQTVTFACLSQSSPSPPIQEDSTDPEVFSCVFKGCTPSSFFTEALRRKGEALSAPPCTSVGSLVPVSLCSGSCPEGARRELNLSCADGNTGGGAVGDDGGRNRVISCAVGSGWRLG